MKRISNEVLNNEKVLQLAYRRLSICELLARMSAVKVNIMAIGSENVWIINAKTSHKAHFAGTHRAIRTQNISNNKIMRNKLHDLILRYSTPGAEVQAFFLSRTRWRPSSHSLLKKRFTPIMQAPGCSLPYSNGIVVPVFYKNPLVADDLEKD